MARTFLLTLLVCLLAAAPAGARRGDEAPENAAYTGLVGVGQALGTLVYAPLKLGYALTGAVIGGMAWAWTGGDSEIANSIVRSSVRGDYVLRRDQVEGGARLAFLGKRY